MRPATIFGRKRVRSGRIRLLPLNIQWETHPGCKRPATPGAWSKGQKTCKPTGPTQLYFCCYVNCLEWPVILSLRDHYRGNEKNMACLATWSYRLNNEAFTDVVPRLVFLLVAVVTPGSKTGSYQRMARHSPIHLRTQPNIYLVIILKWCSSITLNY